MRHDMPAAQEDGGYASGQVAGPPALSERESQVLRHLADGASTAQIATALSISTNTVRTRIRHLAGKLAVHGRQQLVYRARELGIV